MKNKKGFTLLEMVVVVIIISILFLLTIPNVSRVISSVDSKACQALTKVVDSAIVQFRLDYGSDPGSLTDLVNGGYLEPEQTRCSNGESLSIYDGHCVIN
ncbi:MAG: prepilin-type N-terminal cleavage/methylation domain-containing protein [Erysipelotrichaceae bacterium]|jgi:competence protein ComGC|nr:prepilin-type N-terminal cleavage/methylation domain-containing protein [Erysipelotrichaceae bacterium]